MGAAGGRRRRLTSRSLVLDVLVVLAIPLWFAVTNFTGSPGPGVLRRYPTADLRVLANKVDVAYASANCGRRVQIATVDWLAYRVVLQPDARNWGGATLYPLGSQGYGYSFSRRDLSMIDNPHAGIFPPGHSCP